MEARRSQWGDAVPGVLWEGGGKEEEEEEIIRTKPSIEGTIQKWRVESGEAMEDDDREGEKGFRMIRGRHGDNDG